jgi:hypothetical protein
LIAIAEDIGIAGYTPEKIQKTCWIVNQLFETLHLDFTGYVADLLVQCESSEDIAELCESLNIDQQEAFDFKGSISLSPPLKGLELLKTIINNEDLSVISGKSIYFAANGLLDLDGKGCSPIIDYSTASIQFVKALEVQLGDLFREWISRLSPESINFSATRSGIDIKSFLDTNRMFSIGTMAFLLREVSESNRNPVDGPQLPAHHALANALGDFTGLEPLLSKKFYKRFLSKVSHSYRNGGAHDQKIELSVCLECRDAVLGKSNQKGWLPIIAHAKQGLKDHLDS